MNTFFYTVINHKVKKSLGLTNNEYIVIDTISQLSKSGKYDYGCVISNKKISDLLGISEKTVQRAISNGIELGIIERENSKKRTTNKGNDIFTPSSNLECSQVANLDNESHITMPSKPKDNQKHKEIFENIYSVYKEKLLKGFKGRIGSVGKEWSNAKKKLSFSEDELESIKDGLTGMIKHHSDVYDKGDGIGTDPRTYIPMFQTFINQKKWEDYI